MTDYILVSKNPLIANLAKPMHMRIFCGPVHKTHSARLKINNKNSTILIQLTGSRKGSMSQSFPPGQYF
jgi:hypothetical protein